MEHRRIEEAALNAWPGLTQLLCDGWIVRFAGGYSRRANSVTPLYESRLPLAEKVPQCERMYEERRLPCMFRLISITPDRPLDALLAQRGYARQAPTEVLARTLRSRGPVTLPPSGEPRDGAARGPAFVRGRTADAPELLACDIDTWLPVYSKLQGASPTDRERHGRILAAIPSRPLLLTLSLAGRAVACGMGVLAGSHFGLFDIVTAADERRRGRATYLVSCMLDWARQRGAREAYLQVMRENEPALRLYEKLGFQRAYHYWYRVPERLAPGP